MTKQISELRHSYDQIITKYLTSHCQKSQSRTGRYEKIWSFFIYLFIFIFYLFIFLFICYFFILFFFFFFFCGGGVGAGDSLESSGK